MAVPWPGADRTWSRPPRAASRSAMFRRPDPRGVRLVLYQDGLRRRRLALGRSGRGRFYRGTGSQLGARAGSWRLAMICVLQAVEAFIGDAN